MVIKQFDELQQARRNNLIFLVVILAELAVIILSGKAHEAKELNFCQDMGGSLMQDGRCIIKADLNLCVTPQGKVMNAVGRTTINVTLMKGD